MRAPLLQFVHQDGNIAMHVTVSQHGSSSMYRVSHMNTMREVDLTVVLYDTKDVALQVGINHRLDCYNDIMQIINAHKPA